jgi:flavin reductase (DIM6/NTAB) family NADH-FMN oxidoreductase RutF
MPGCEVRRADFKPELLREALGLFPTGITVVTAKARYHTIGREAPAPAEFANAL